MYAPMPAPHPEPVQSSKPAKFAGKPTAGTPTLSELEQARKGGTLKINEKGYATTPKVRKVSRGLKQAKRVAAKSQPSLTGLSPAERAVVPLARKAHRKYPDIPVSVLMAQDKQESGFDPAAVSSAGAQGLSQFIPSTAAEYGVKYGTGRREQQSQVTGQAHLLHAEGFASDPQGALSAYSGGYAAGDYNNPILVDAKASYSRLDKPGDPRARKVLRRAKKQARKVGLAAGRTNAGVLQAFDKQVRQQLKLVKAGKYTTGPGKLVLDSGVSITQGHEPEIAARLKLLSAKVGKPVYIISGYRSPAHSVAVGGFSNDPHTEGKAADIGVGAPTLSSAAAISESVYESVGLYRPFGTARGGSSAEDNHVQLLHGGTPATGGSAAGSTGGGAVSGAAVTSYAQATGLSVAKVKAKLRRKELTPTQILHKLAVLGAGVGQVKEKEAPSRTGLHELERKYGSPAV